MSAHTARGILDTTHAFRERGIEWTVDTLINESLVTRARNTLVARFLASNATHLLFIDADIAFHPNAVLGLLDAQKDVVCCAYPKKCINWDRIGRAARAGEQRLERLAADYAINFLQPKDQPPGPDGMVEVEMRTDNGCIPILDAATGFLLMTRESILRVIDHYRDELLCVSDAPDTRGHPYWAVFDTMVEKDTRRYLSEDYAFSRRWQATGGTVWLFLSGQLGHVGTMMFAGDMQTLVRPKEETPKDGTFHFPPMLDHVAAADLIGVLNGSYDVPVDDAELVLDIGANVGCFSAWARKKWPNARVLAYEPHPKNTELLVKNAPFAEVFENAVRAEAGTALLREGGPNLGCSSFTDLGLQSERVLEVSCLAAEDLPAADVVKVDTEGCEVEILEHLDLSRAKAVMLEYHSEGDRRSVMRILQAKGLELLSEQPGDRGTGTQKWLRKAAQEAA